MYVNDAQQCLIIRGKVNDGPNRYILCQKSRTMDFPGFWSRLWNLFAIIVMGLAHNGGSMHQLHIHKQFLVFGLSWGQQVWRYQWSTHLVVPMVYSLLMAQPPHLKTHPADYAIKSDSIMV